MSPPRSSSSSKKNNQKSPDTSHDSEKTQNAPPLPKKSSSLGLFLFFQVLILFSIFIGFLFSPHWLPPLRQMWGISDPSLLAQTHKTEKAIAPYITSQKNLESRLSTLEKKENTSINTLTPYIASQKNLESRLDTLEKKWAGANDVLEKNLQANRSFEDETLASLKDAQRHFDTQNTLSRRTHLTNLLRFLALALRTGGADDNLLQSLTLFDDDTLVKPDLLDAYRSQAFPSSSLLFLSWHDQDICLSSSPPQSSPSPSPSLAPAPSETSSSDTFSFSQFFSRLFQDLVHITPLEESSSPTASSPNPCLSWHAKIATNLKNHHLKEALHQLENPPLSSSHTLPFLEKLKTLHELDNLIKTSLQTLTSSDKKTS